MCQSTLSSNMSHESRMDDKQFAPRIGFGCVPVQGVIYRIYDTLSHFRDLKASFLAMTLVDGAKRI